MNCNGKKDDGTACTYEGSVSYLGTIVLCPAHVSQLVMYGAIQLVDGRVVLWRGGEGASPPARFGQEAVSGATVAEAGGVEAGEEIEIDLAEVVETDEAKLSRLSRQLDRWTRRRDRLTARIAWAQARFDKLAAKIQAKVADPWTAAADATQKDAQSDRRSEAVTTETDAPATSEGAPSVEKTYKRWCQHCGYDWGHGEDGPSVALGPEESCPRCQADTNIELTDAAAPGSMVETRPLAVALLDVVDLVNHAIGNLLAPVYANAAVRDVEELISSVRAMQPRLRALLRALSWARRGDARMFSWWSKRVDPHNLSDAEREEVEPPAEEVQEPSRVDAAAQGRSEP